MDTRKKLKEEIDELDNDFDNLIKNKKLDISSIGDVALKTVENVNSIINKHIEELLSKKIDEKDLISKKKKSGKKKDLN